jgi:hypothetical protein
MQTAKCKSTARFTGMAVQRSKRSTRLAGTAKQNEDAKARLNGY